MQTRVEGGSPRANSGTLWLTIGLSQQTDDPLPVKYRICLRRKSLPSAKQQVRSGTHGFSLNKQPQPLPLAHKVNSTGKQDVAFKENSSSSSRKVVCWSKEKHKNVLLLQKYSSQYKELSPLTRNDSIRSSLTIEANSSSVSKQTIDPVWY